MLRVAHVFKATGLSGAEAHLLLLASGLRAHSIESHLLVLTDPARWPKALFAECERRGIPYSALPLRSDVDLSVVGKLKTEFARRNIGLVHTHMIHGDLFGTLAAAQAKLPVVQSRHNDDKFRRRWAVRLINRLLAARASAIVAISDWIAKFAHEVEGVPLNKVRRIYYGYEPTLLAAEAGALRREMNIASSVPLVGAVGRLTEQKGFRFLLDAFALTLAAIPGARLALAGDGPLRGSLEAQAGALGVERAVAFLGWRNDVAKLMNDIDVFVMPSLWEGFGLVTLEAMAAGKPIIASNIGALPEIVADNQTGIIVPPADAKAIATALISLLKDRAKGQSMGHNGRARLEGHFTVERMARQHAELYREIVPAPPK